MAHIVILTNAFPYHPGEQFLEEELVYWGRDTVNKIVILPISGSGEPRKVQDNISVQHNLLVRSKIKKFFWAVRALFSVIFFIEIRYIVLNKKNLFQDLSQALRSTMNTLLLSHGLGQYVRENDEIDVVYSYWNEVAAYAACIEKRKGRVRRVVSRAHGYDLYEHRRTDDYMPLKRQFMNDFDAVYFLSEEGRSYFSSTYGASLRSLYISPLGVRVPQEVSKSSLPGVVNVISVSYCSPIKRIDKILRAVSVFSDLYGHLDVIWTHIGNGELFTKLTREGEKIEKIKNNLKINFMGGMSNLDVLEFYMKNPVDVFINTSDSEGMPVSIMEAMAAGVPVVAPDVGGMAYLVSMSTGCLLDEDPSVNDILNGLEKVIFSSDIEELRKNAKQLIVSKFNSEVNYSNFISNICSLTVDDISVS